VFKLSAAALANKVARVVYARMTRGDHTTADRSRPEQKALQEGVFAAMRSASRAAEK
jgi:hypothetical protein